MKNIYTLLLFAFTLAVSAQDDFEKAFETERDSIQKLMELAADNETELNRLINLSIKREEAFQKEFLKRTNAKIAQENSKIKSKLDEIEAETIKKLDSIVKANDKELASMFKILDDAPTVKSELLLKFEDSINKDKNNIWIEENFSEADLKAIAKELKIVLTDKDDSKLVDIIKKHIGDKKQ